jgi:hypothetical protein
MNPLSITGHGIIFSDYFHVHDVSLVHDLTMQLMSVGQITDHDCHVILDPDVCYIQNHHTSHLVGTGPVVVIHSVFESLTDFIFLPLRLSVLSAPLMLLHPRHRLLNDIIIWIISVTPNCLHCFIEDF